VRDYRERSGIIGIIIMIKICQVVADAIFIVFQIILIYCRLLMSLKYYDADDYIC